MKLEQAVIDYGLKPASSADFVDWRELKFETVACRQRVDTIIDRLNNQVFAGCATIVGSLTYGNTVSSAGMNFDGLERHGEYAWNITIEVRTNRHWRCGLVEAMYRRYVLESIDAGRLSGAVYIRASDWERTWNS